MHVVLVSTRATAAHARASARYAARHQGLDVTVLDADGWYAPHGAERVLRPTEAGLGDAALHRLAATVPPDRLAAALLPSAVEAAGDGRPVLALAPGVLLLADPAPLVDDVPGFAVALRAAAGPPDDRRPSVADLAADGVASTHLLLLVDPPAGLLADWRRGAAAGPGGRWLDVAALRGGATVLPPTALLQPTSLRRDAVVAGGPDALTLDGEPVVAVDLTALDPRRPWWWGTAADADDRGRLSEHPALAALVARVAAEVADDERASRGGEDLATTSLGVPVDEPMRALLAGDDTAPDPFDPAGAAALLDWLAAVPAAGRVARYLDAVRATRPDLRAAYPPGGDQAGYLAWVRAHATAEGYAAVVVDRALAALPGSGAVRPAPGVEVIGYLTGELGIGESARLLVGALDASGVRHREHPVDLFLLSGRRAAPAPPAGGTALDTAVICVNADLTPSVAAAVPGLLAGRYRIGMWYWEVEDFPASQHAGFAAVDEVWVATDFVRRAVEPHSPVPVRTLTPPLPQRGASPVPTRHDLGLPDGPLLLFSFDHLSTLERKNPLGVLDAFTAAFRPGEGPTLVLKSLNATLRPADAERVRLAAAGRPDVVLVERYLAPAERDGLVAACDAFVSLHRSEGLGLGMAEAMAWGKPVVATGYGGNLQFMTDENSVLVPWAPVPIGPDAAPYPAGGTWAEPDLDAAARALRRLVERPDEARALGERAAADIATRHTPAVAGAAIAARLDELAGRRRARASSAAVDRTARRLRAALASRRPR